MKKVFVILILMIQFFSLKTAYAMDTLYALTHEKQYALAVGEVIEVDTSSAKIRIEEIISGEKLPDIINVEIPGDFLPKYEPALRPNDYFVLSINKNGQEYAIAMGYYRVTRLDIKTLEILEGPLPPGDLAALQWYINSGGTENDFYFIESDAYVRHSDGSSTMIYHLIEAIPSPIQTEKVVEITNSLESYPPPTETARQSQASNIGIFIAGVSVAVFFTALLFFRKKAG